MARPSSIDAREGLSSETLADFRAARWVLLGLKDHHAAVALLGLDGDTRFVVLRAGVQRTHGANLDAEQPLRIPAAQTDVLWRTAVDGMNPGDMVTVERSLGWAAVSVVLSGPTHQQRVAIPRPSAAELRRWTVPMTRSYLIPGMRVFSRRERRYFLGHAVARGRWRVGQPTWIRRPAE